MKRTLLSSVLSGGALATAIGLLAAPFSPASAAGTQAVAPWVARATVTGTADESKTVQITAFLSLRNVDALKVFIDSVSKPASPNYGKYLTPEQFRAAYAPLPADVARVQQSLSSLGFKVINTPASGLFVEATGTVRQIRSAFGVSQNLYTFKGHTLRANAEQPKMPAGLAGVVRYVAGLDDSAVLRQPNHRRIDDAVPKAGPGNTGAQPDAPPPVAAGIISPFCSHYWGDEKATLSSAPGPYPTKLPWLLCGYTPAQINQAYGINKVSQDGNGVKVGIVDTYASPTIAHDANRYSRIFNLPELTYLNFQQIIPKGIYKVPPDDPCGPQGWYGEETLDVEAVHSTAPGANIVYAGNSCTDPGNSALYNLIDNHIVDIVTNSYSYGGENVPPDFIESENQYFMQAAAEGMSLLFSSGDDGDLAAGNGIASGTWDATSPYVTAVGGTSLALLDAKGTKQEWGWGDYRVFLDNATVSKNGKTITTSGVTLPLAYYAGEGGGPSLSQLAPDYQANVPYRLSGFTYLANGRKVPLETPHRVTPDISMVGDPYTGFTVGETYTISGDPITDAPCKPMSDTLEYCLTTIGGTSLSSPLFAGVLALANQSRLNAGKPTVGFVNPALYSMSVGEQNGSAPIIDVRPPRKPTAVLRGYLGDPTEVRLVTMNSDVAADGTTVLEGVNTTLLTRKGYDEGSGLGTPYVPALIQAFGK